MGVRDHVLGLHVLGDPLPGTARAFDEFPVVGEHHFEIALVPAGGVRFPGPFNARGDGVLGFAGMKGVVPTKALCMQWCTFRFCRGVGRWCGAMALAEGVTTGHQCHGFFNTHAHARKRFTHISAGGDGIRFAARTLRIDVDQAHLHGCQRLVQVSLCVSPIVVKPSGLAPPEHILLGLPDVDAPAGKSKGAESHRLQRHIAREDDQIGPGNGIAVFALDRPEQTSCFIEIGVVRPTVERRKSLVPMTSPTAAITCPVGPSAVPGHADEQRSVMPPISRPPILRIRHQGLQVGFQTLVIKAREGLRVVEVVSQRIGGRMVLMQDPQVDLIGPPVVVAGATGGSHGTGVAAEGAFQLGHRAFQINTPPQGIQIG